MSEKTPETTKLKIRYESMTAQYAAQVILNATQEEMFFDFSSGVVPDPETGGACVSVHTRIAMSPAGAKRLYELLGKSLGVRDDSKEDS